MATINDVEQYLAANTSGDPANILNGLRALVRNPHPQEKVSEPTEASERVQETSTKVTLRERGKSD